MSTALYAREDVRRRLDARAALRVVERTYVGSARGRVLNPAKATMHMGDDGAWPHLNAFSVGMPAYVGWLGVAGTKWAVAAWEAPTDAPISARLLLFDPERGAFTAIMEGTYLTGVRTALQSVVGLTHLAPAPPETVGLIGAGFQARFQLLVIDDLCDVASFRLFDTDAATARDLADAVGPRLEAGIRVVDSAGAAAASDAVVTATDARTPVLADDRLADAGLVVALGSYRELPDRTILGADHLVVDHVEQCLQRGALADLADRGGLTRADVSATIGEVLAAGDRDVGPDDRAVFVPIGLGALDVAIGENLRRDGDGAAGSEPGSVRAFDFG